jgi:hypothetical protein
MLTLVRQGRTQFANTLANRQRLLAGKTLSKQTQFSGNFTDIRGGAVFTTAAEERAIIAAAAAAAAARTPSH